MSNYVSMKSIMVIVTCMALQMTGFVIVLPLFTRRFRELGTGVEALGISTMVYAFASTLTALFMGTLADRFGRRSMVLMSLAVYVAAFCRYLLAGSAVLLVVIRGLAGAFIAGLIPAVTGLIYPSTGQQTKDETDHFKCWDYHLQPIVESES
jgi:DHA1 family bicyclomycin/chloramphenicol resistance-like MFS transporter